MKRFFSGYFLLSLLLPLCGCEGLDLFRLGIGLQTFQLGTESSVGSLDDMTEAQKKQLGGTDRKIFSAFADAETLSSGEFSEALGLQYGKGSEVEYSGDLVTLKVRPVPEYARLDSVSALSSDGAVLSVEGYSADRSEIHVRTRTLGDVTLSVSVSSGGKEVKLDFPLRVVSYLDVEFSCAPYWLGSFAVRLRYRPLSLPKGYESVFTSVKDSVTVCGVCEYYDFAKYGHRKQVSRDTIRLARQDRNRLMKSGHKVFLRNISPALEQMRSSRYCLGSKIETRPDGTRDTVSHKYYYAVEKVILDFSAYSYEPYFVYRFTTAQDRRTDTRDADGNVLDTGSDEDEPFDSSLDGKALPSEGGSSFFEVRYCPFMSLSEMQAEETAMQKRLSELGYDETLSDQDKEKCIGELENM